MSWEPPLKTCFVSQRAVNGRCSRALSLATMSCRCACCCRSSGRGVPATAASTPGAAGNVSSRAEDSQTRRLSLQHTSVGCRGGGLVIRCCASCRYPRSQGVDACAGRCRLCLLSQGISHGSHTQSGLALISPHPRTAHLRSTPSISPLHDFAHSHTLHAANLSINAQCRVASESHVRLCEPLRYCTLRRCPAPDRRRATLDRTRTTSTRAVQKGIAPSTPFNVRQSRAPNVQIVCASLKDSPDTLLDACRAACMALFTRRVTRLSLSG
jgi:hypothetical protein